MKGLSSPGVAEIAGEKDQREADADEEEDGVGQGWSRVWRVRLTSSRTMMWER